MIYVETNTNRHDVMDRPNNKWAASDSAGPCAICGKAIHKAQVIFYLHLHNGGCHAVTEMEAAALPENADLGFYPLGADCLRAHPELRPYVQTPEDENTP